MLRKLLGGLFVLGVLVLVFASGASASGPLSRWIKEGTVVYNAPDPMGDELRVITETVPVSVTITFPGWAQLYDPKAGVALGEFVQTTDLLKQEPPEIQQEREQAALNNRKIGDMTYAELVALLHLQGQAPVTPGIGASTATAMVIQMITTDESIWVRDAPSSTAAIVKKLAKGTIVMVLEEKVVGGVTWVRVGDNEWMRTTYLTSYNTATIPPVTSATTPANWPATAQEFLAVVTAGQPAAPSDKSWMPIELSEIHRPVGEPNAWAVTREKDKAGSIVPFWVRNFTGRAQDGYCQAANGKYTTGTPANFAGLSQGVTFRP